MITFEDWLSVDLKGKATGMAAVVRRAVAALRRARADAAVIGAIALGLRARERATRDIDFVAYPRRWKQVIRAMREAGFRDHPEWRPDEHLARFIDPKTKLGVDVLFGMGDPEDGARETAQVRTLFGVRLRVARADYLLWMYLGSDRPQHHEDGLSIIRSRGVDLPPDRGRPRCAPAAEAVDPRSATAGDELNRAAPTQDLRGGVTRPRWRQGLTAVVALRPSANRRSLARSAVSHVLRRTVRSRDRRRARRGSPRGTSARATAAGAR